MILATRSRISRAALLVKVTVRIWLREGAAGEQDMGKAGGEDARLAGARASQDQDGAFGGFDGVALGLVQAF